MTLIGGRQSELVLENVKREDLGAFTCLAKNSLGEASALLKSSDIGQIIFRPSTRGPNHLNCTWKFFENIIIHLDIDEKDSRLPGANIGSKLWISDESFDNL